MGGNDWTIDTQYQMNYEVCGLNFKIVLDPMVLANPERSLTVHRCKDMPFARQYFGICAINNFIYVSGGQTSGY
jgi:hypothetical protein